MVDTSTLFSDILKAKERLKGVINQTHLQYSKTFSRWSRGEIYLKPENLQKTGSFKIRGAYNKISTLTEAEKRKGVITASSGNHAQGVAYSASLLGVKATIVMPIDAPKSKVEAVKDYGGNIIFHGQTSSERIERAAELAHKEGLIMIHSFNDPYVIAGQGTIGIEILEELPDTDIILVPIGGGGLISGISIAAKEKNKDIAIIGVEAEGAPTMTKSLRVGKLIKLDSIDTIADGIRTTQVGSITFEIAKELVNDVVLVNDEEIKEAVFYLLQRGKLLVEPSGAVTVAAVLSKKVNVKGKKCVAVLSGGNIDMALLKEIVTL